MTTAELEKRNARCCMEHLERMGYGSILKGTIDGTPTETLLIGGHCIDGQRARCKTCKRVWQHVCDEAEGCSWNEVIPKQRKAKSGGKAA